MGRVGAKICLSAGLGITMTAQKKIEKAKARLMLEHPYFGTIASAMDMAPSWDVQTFLSDGKTLKYNSDYFDSASVDDVVFSLANGAMHTLLKHQKRAGERQDRLWQYATDYTINSMLLKNGLSLPEQANYQNRFDGMYAEEVYEILRSELSSEISESDEGLTETDDNLKIDDEKQMPKEASWQDAAEPSKDSADEDTQNHEEPQPEMDLDDEKRQAEEFFEQLMRKMNRQGTLPKGLKYVVPELFSYRVDWREQLYRYIAEHAKSSFTFIPPNMKYLYRGIYLPSLSSDMLRIIIAIDTSGSVDEKLLGIFLGEVQSITQQYPNYEIDIITADSKVQSHQIFLPGESLDYEIKGRGGTDFRPVFDYIDRYIDYPTLLLYFTDGLGTFPPDEPPYDLLWIMPKEVNVPFGQSVILE